MNPQKKLLPEPGEQSLEASAFPCTAEPELDTDMEFFLRSPKIPDMTLGYPSGFNMTESLFSALTTDTLYDCHDYFNPGIPSAGSQDRPNSLCTGLADFLSRPALPHLDSDVFGPTSDTLPEDTPDVSPSVSNSYTTDDTSSSAPSTPSEIPASPGGSSRLRPHGIYRCPEPGCQRSFKSQYTLSKHTQAHRPKTQSPFPCTMGCALEFSRKHDRLRHEVTQHGRVCAKCGACRGFFSSEVTLNKHKCKIRARP
ncbi:hypothetical protein B0H17DRAFT_1039118 [Mycena rosella]|uniref:C2H2-type domain-containing protein n=1 Tax=Mycena rosella TaxID=1033263 RepID=A0AAD7M7W6_MYCRO|nr:hypothetical protein B0H17DRAFT_1039118 [Mycena rosella]